MQRPMPSSTQPSICRPTGTVCMAAELLTASPGDTPRGSRNGMSTVLEARNPTTCASMGATPYG